MSYSQAPATRMLATHCGACARPLVDATSVEAGLGPECRKQYLSINLHSMQANALIYRLALAQSGAAALQCSEELRALGFEKLADRVMVRCADVIILDGEEGLMIRTPFVEAAAEDWRRIPGRRWEKAMRYNVVPSNQRFAVWALLQKHHAGTVGVGPRGVFTIKEVA